MRHSRRADLIIGRIAVSLENAFELSGTASAHRVHGLKGSRTPRFPRQLSVEIKRVIAEGDLVVTHDLVRGAPDDPGRHRHLPIAERQDCRALGDSTARARVIRE